MDALQALAKRTGPGETLNPGILNPRILDRRILNPGAGATVPSFGVATLAAC